MEKMKFFVKQGDYLTLSAPYMEMYITVEWLGKLCIDAGVYMEVFGIMQVRVFDANDKILKEDFMNLPSMINIYPDSTERRTVNINGEETKVIVAQFHKGSRVTDSKFRQNSTNAEQFLNLLTSGKLPKIIPYDKVLGVWKKNLAMNGVKLGVPSFVFELFIREVYRNKDKREEPFGMEAGKHEKVDMLNYSQANMREICAQNSTFAAISFEDMDSMIITSLNRSKLNKSETVSPIEKIIKY